MADVLNQSGPRLSGLNPSGLIPNARVAIVRQPNGRAWSVRR